MCPKRLVNIADLSSMSGVGDKISGLARGVSGAGDMLRGGFNDFADRAGDAVTGRNDADSNTRNSGVTNNGAEDLNEGIRRFQGEGHRETANEKKAAEERAKERTVGDSQFSQANENFRKSINDGIDSIGERIAGRR